jgi:hypothetical protein
MKRMKRISKVTIKRMTDTDPDTSYLGNYSNRAETDYAIDRRHSIDCPVNAGTDNRLLWFTSSSGRIELQMTMEHAESASHQGDCDEDTRELSKVPAIAEQLTKIDPAVLSAELKEYGAWDAEELSDHDQNLQRVLWLAAGDISERDGCDCGERGDAGHGEFRYFNGCVENYKGESPEDIRKYVRQDYERMERLQHGDWCYIGIRAEAEILVPSGSASVVQEITSGGLWGVESDSDREYLAEIEAEELSSLREQLQAVGFSKRAVSAAVKNATHENA